MSKKLFDWFAVERVASATWQDVPADEAELNAMVTALVLFYNTTHNIVRRNQSWFEETRTRLDVLLSLNHEMFKAWHATANMLISQMIYQHVLWYWEMIQDMFKRKRREG